MIFKCGIIGLPNVGKSTLFNILTDSSVKDENFLFCTIQANKGLFPMLDIRLFQLLQCAQINHTVYDNIVMIDIAGLIKGASRGEGLGNRFLHDISEVDILLHVVRCFDRYTIHHINNTVNPKNDIAIIHDELILYDIFLCEGLIFSFEKNKKYESNKLKRQILDFLKKILIHLYNSTMLCSLILNSEEITIIKKFNFLTFKPMVYIANIGSNNDNDDYLLELSDIALNTNIPYIPICILSEKKISKLKVNNIISSIDFFNQYVIKSKFFEIINVIYQILQVKTFFTINMHSVKSWVVSKNIVAIEASNIIHSDFKKYFIRVQVVKYSDFIFFQGWKQSKKFGKIKNEGKNYLIQDGDILNFLI